MRTSVRITGNDVHCYRLPATDGDFAVVAGQRNAVDVRIATDAGHGVDSPQHDGGDEYLFVTGDVRDRLLRLTSKLPPGVTATYSIELQPLAPRELSTALRHRDALRASAGDGSGDSSAELMRVSDAWWELGRTRRAAVAAQAAAYVARKAGDASAADNAFRVATGRYLAAGALPDAAATMNSHALLLMERGQFDEAARMLDAALELQGGQASEVLAGTLNNQGLLHHHQGRLDEAHRLYSKAADVNKVLGRDDRRLAQLNNIGGIHFVRGDARTAADAFRQVATLSTSLGLKESRAHALGNLALVHNGSGSHLEALATYSELLQVYGEVDDPHGRARTLDRMGGTYAALGDYPRAVSYLEQAVAQREHLDDRLGAVQSLRRLAEVRLEQDNVIAASQAVDKALAIGPSRTDAGKLGLTSGRILIAQDELAAAGRTLAAAVKDLEESGELAAAAMARLYAAEAAIRAGDGVSEPELERIRRVLADAELVAGETHLAYVQALQAFRRGHFEKALQHLSIADAAIERVRQGVVLADLRATHASTTASIRDLKIDVLMALHERDPNGNHALRALLESERAKAGRMQALLHQNDVLPGGAASEFAVQRQRLLRDIGFRVSRAGIGAIGQDEELAGWLAQLDVVEAKVAAAAPRYVSLMRSMDESFLPRLRRMLRSDGVLLHYHLGETRSYLWTLTDTEIRISHLPARQAIESQVETLRGEVERRASPDAVDTAAAALSMSVLQPIEDILAARGRVFVVADGALHFVPFSALSTGAQPLLLRHAVTMLPSIAAGLQPSRETVSEQRLTATLIGDPVYERDDPRLDNIAAVGDPPTLPAGRLAATARELDAIAAALPAARVEYFRGLEANRDLLRDDKVVNADVLHFAVHGLFDSEAPALSGLLMSRFDRQGRLADGFVGLRDIYALDLNAKLVVLSGCETALGQRLDGIGVIGLTGGFLGAGATQVVSSLWRIPDAPTAEFMKHFYRNLDTLDVAAALRAAQMTMRETRRWRHPYFWAGFVVQGDSLESDESSVAGTTAQLKTHVER